MKLSEINKRYEEIMQSDDQNKCRHLADLMTEMERHYKIPMLQNEEWEKENKAVIAMYRKISMSR